MPPLKNKITLYIEGCIYVFLYDGPEMEIKWIIALLFLLGCKYESCESSE